MGKVVGDGVGSLQNFERYHVLWQILCKVSVFFLSAQMSFFVRNSRIVADELVAALCSRSTFDRVSGEFVIGSFVITSLTTDNKQLTSKNQQPTPTP